MLCLKKRRTYSFTQGTCVDLPRRSKKDTARYEGSLNMAITTLPRKNRSNREERPSGMVLTVTEDTPADMLAGSMELLVQLPREHHLHTQRVTVQRSTPMMDLLVQIATAHKLAASNYTLQAIGERGLILPHQPNTPIGALDALQVKLLPKQCTFVPKKVKHANQPFETTFRLQVHLPRNQLYVSRVSPKMNLGEILNEVCREKNLDKHKYELRHPVNLEEILDLNLSLQDYHLQEVTLYAKQGRTLGSALSSQDIMALQRQEERRRQQAKQSVFGFMFKKSKESSVSTDSLEGRSVSPARSDETGRSASPLQQPPTRPQRKRRLAPKPPASSNHEPQQQQQQQQASTTVNSKITTNTNTTAMATSTTTTTTTTTRTTNVAESSKEKMLIGHSRNSSDSSGYHEASVLSDNPDIAGGRLPETLPRRSKAPGTNETPRKLVHTSQSSKSLGNLAVTASGTSLDRALSSSSLSSTGLKKKRAAPPPPVSRPLSSAISTQALERIDDSEESLTSDMDPSKPPSDIGVPSKASSDIGVSTIIIDKSDHSEIMKNDQNSINVIEDPVKVENARVDVKRDVDKKLCDTDVLLHKVSETLSSSSLTSTNEEETDNVYSMINKKMDKNCRKELHKDNEEIKNQQDTSDYVSALEEDSSIVDWEYQLPAPPSAFRDNDSQIFDGYDTVTLRSVDAFKETLVENENESINSNRISEVENKTLTIDKNQNQNQNKQMEIFKNKLDKKCNKNEIILELENKIEKGTLSRCHKEIDSKKIVNNNNNLKLTSNVAPIDNTLSNFTITTYTRQKSIDIFKDEKDNNNSVGDETSRNKKIEPKICNNDVESKIGIVQRSKSHVSTISQNKLKNEIEDNKMMNTKIEKLDNAISEVNDFKQMDNTTLRTNNDKFSQWRDNMLKRQDEPTKEKQLQSLQVLKSILPQLTNSQPAEENVTKERNVGFTEKMKNRYETESNENFVTTSVFSTPSESHVTAQDDNKNNTIQKDTNTKRRYVYNGPPAISLGSWAERSSVKVQIKTDIDYKFANDKFNKNNTNNTIVPMNNKEQSKETNDKHDRNDDLTKKFINHATVSGLRKLPSTNQMKNEEKPIVTSVELKKPMKLEQNVEIRHHKDNDKDNENLIDTTPLNFQQLTKTFRLDIDQRIKPSQRNIANRHSEYYGSQQELIRKSIETNKQNGHTKLDEFPIVKKNVLKNHASSLINENHNSNFSTTEKKPFTTIVGINSYNHRQQEQSIQKNNNISLKNNVNNNNNNNNNIKINSMSAPVVKGFKVSSTIPFAESKVINKVDKLNQNKDVVDGQVTPKAPTMPVIMGVTLKSANARPKSMPINVDSRDMLLESIRNFGGRGQLKNTAERY